MSWKKIMLTPCTSRENSNPICILLKSFVYFCRWCDSEPNINRPDVTWLGVGKGKTISCLHWTMQTYNHVHPLNNKGFCSSKRNVLHLQWTTLQVHKWKLHNSERGTGYKKQQNHNHRTIFMNKEKTHI